MKLFLDDLRNPPDDTWWVARSSKAGIDFLLAYGMPDEISFDHDLGGDDTAMVFINTMIEMVLDGNLKIHPEFDYTIHSANPVGCENIKSKMDGFLKFIRS